MNDILGILQVLSVMLALAAAWACHRAGKHAPSARALAWHAVSVLLILRAINAVARLYAPSWRPFEQLATTLLLIATALALAMLARSFVIPQNATEETS